MNIQEEISKLKWYEKNSNSNYLMVGARGLRRKLEKSLDKKNEIRESNIDWRYL